MKIEFFNQDEKQSPFRVGANILFKGTLWTVVKYIEHTDKEPSVTLKSASGLNDETITLTPTEFGMQEKAFFHQADSSIGNAAAKLDGVKRKLAVLLPLLEGSLKELMASNEMSDKSKVVISEALGLSLLMGNYMTSVIRAMNLVARDMKTTMDAVGFEVDEVESNNPIGTLVATLMSEGVKGE